MKKNEIPSSNKILILLSGPEPQRTILENILLKQTEKIDTPFLLVRGLPSETSQPVLPPNVTSFNYVGASELAEAISAASIIICRSGYSSLMDIVKMGKKAILIPTPGQTEQEYLGQRFMDKKMFVCQKQAEVDLVTGLKQLNEIQEHIFPIDFEQYKKALSDLGIK
jgi:UDP-N-acetylglucosamine:LPS N-acetylglucosamine transferase